MNIGLEEPRFLESLDVPVFLESTTYKKRYYHCRQRNTTMISGVVLQPGLGAPNVVPLLDAETVLGQAPLHQT